jgi:hypothetical protein
MKAEIDCVPGDRTVCTKLTHRLVRVHLRALSAAICVEMPKLSPLATFAPLAWLEWHSKQSSLTAA